MQITSENRQQMDASMGYAAIALRRMLFDVETVLAVVAEMRYAFQDTPPEKAIAVLKELRGDKQ